MPTSKNESNFSAYALGLEFVAYIAAAGGIGWAVDTYAVGTGGKTWMTTGLIFGLVGGMYRFIRQALSANKQTTREFKEHHPSVPRLEEEKPKMDEVD